ncbi:TonB-dependent receptor [Sphingobacteriaceae bacterium WQ 2009]|uniref:TonB-dependent receptor n=1 Tax=Rhinopithecimicrobium faecis TaxID=2820698 RepID=A0A8T4H9P0_9SPHI|nr:TonB-dependent receptor [Sphingobacteriaceae bacterium WQ 2009]
MRYTLILAFCLLFGLSTQAQNKLVQGFLRDASSRVVAGASVKLTSDQDSLLTSSSMSGLYVFDNVKAKSFKITVSSIGYETYTNTFEFPAGVSKFNIPSFQLNATSQQLEEVVIDGVTTVIVKSDTLEYGTANLKLRDGALVEDALKKLEGIEVAADGKVTAQGEEIKRIRINGKDFFGGDVKTATQNLPADIIQKIQIIDDYGDMANLTGNKTGDSEKIINIQIDPEKNKGYMTTLRMGYGTDDRYQATGMYMAMKEGMQFSALGNLNNINAPLFDFNTAGGGARRMQGGGGRGPGGGGGFGGSTGLTNAGSLGLNYRQDFSPKLTVYGSYSYSHDDQDVIATSVNQYTFPDSILLKNSNSTTNTIGNNHRFEANLEWKPTLNDFIKLSPTLSFRKSEVSAISDIKNYFRGTASTTEDILYSSEYNTNNSLSKSPNYGISGLYNRKLNDNGRNVFFNMNVNSGASKQDQERIIETIVKDPNNMDMTEEQVYRRTLAELDNKSWNGGASVSYIEPLSQFGKLEVSYDYNINTYDNTRNQRTFKEDGGIFDSPGFNFDRTYDYSFSTHRVGANYNYAKDKIKYAFGASVQPSILDGDAYVDGKTIGIRRNGFNFVPIARFEYKFNRQKNLSINYSGNSVEPSITQIQPFTDNSNPTNIITGNADLAAEFRHQLRLRFNSSNFEKGKTFFAMLNTSLSQDKIVSNNLRYADPLLGVVQETGYLNADGAFSVQSFYHYGRSLKKKTYNLMFMGGVSFNNNISFTDSRKNTASNWVFNQGIMFRYNPSENFELNPGVRYQYNTTKNSLTSQSTNVSSWTPTLIGSVNITPTWIFGADLSKSFNNGYGGNLSNVNPFVINSYLEKKFLKANRGTFRLAAFDLLNQQTNISRSVSDMLISDSRTNRLARYFMLTFTYKFQKFAGGIAPQEESGFPGGMRPPRR